MFRLSLTTLSSLIFAFSVNAQMDGISVTLSSTPNPSTYGQPVTLTATVQGQATNAKATFYDGITVLGSGIVSNGQATLVTSLIPSGVRSLRAYVAAGANSATSPSV